MTELDKEVNEIIMREMGLEVGSHDRIYDQDTGMALSINGMKVTAPGVYGGRDSIEFDPHNNRKLMGRLFENFLNKYADEVDNEVIAFYNKDTKEGGCIECKMEDNELISSKPYKRDSLKYTDLIMQLNGGESEDLSKYDIPPVKETIKRKI